MKLLLTAFEPFGGETVNPALEAADRLPGQIGDVELIKLTVPVAFGRSVEVVREAILREAPDAVLSLGQAGGRAALTLERVAINIDDARIPDNLGARPVDEPVVPGGPAAYFATLPIKAMTAAIRAEGVPAAVSNSAGTYVCNHLMYGVLHTLARDLPAARGGFLHLPYLPAQVTDGRAPSLSLEDMVRGLTAAVAAIPAHPRDLPAAEGREC